MISLILLLLLTLFFSALFSGVEMAYVSSNKLKLLISEKKSSITQLILSKIVKKQDEFICYLLVGNNIALTGYGLLFSALLNPFLVALTGNNKGLVLVIETLLSTVVILILGEFLPKSFFRQMPNLALRILAVPIQIMYYILFPITFICMIISNLWLKIIGLDKNKKKSVFSKMDLMYFLEERGENTPNNQSNDVSIIKNALTFNTLKIRDCMVPRIDIEVIEINESIQELKQRFIDTSYSKLLVYKDSPEQILGYVHVKDLFSNPKKIKDMLIPLPIFSEATSAEEVLNTLMSKKKSCAIILDEFGGVSGMVTLEDIIEEIFGEIHDEYDIEDNIEQLIENNIYQFSARLEVDYLNEKYHLEIPISSEYETLAGFIIYHHEDILKKGEEITIQNFQITAIKVADNKIEVVKLEKIASKTLPNQ